MGLEETPTIEKYEDDSIEGTPEKAVVTRTNDISLNVC